MAKNIWDIPAAERRGSLSLTRKEAQAYADSEGKPVHILRVSTAAGYRAAPGYRIIADSTWKAHKNKPHYKGLRIETVRPKSRKNPMKRDTQVLDHSFPTGGGKTVHAKAFVIAPDYYDLQLTTSGKGMVALGPLTKSQLKAKVRALKKLMQ